MAIAWHTQICDRGWQDSSVFCCSRCVSVTAKWSCRRATSPHNHRPPSWWIYFPFFLDILCVLSSLNNIWNAFWISPYAFFLHLFCFVYRQRAHSYNKSFNVNNVLQGCYASFALFALRPLRLTEPFQPVDFTSITVSYISLACPSGPRAATRIRFL